MKLPSKKIMRIYDFGNAGSTTRGKSSQWKENARSSKTRA